MTRTGAIQAMTLFIDLPSFIRNKYTPLKADHPKRPTMTLGWSLEHTLGIPRNNTFLLDFTVSRSGWQGVLICSTALIIILLLILPLLLLLLLLLIIIIIVITHI